MQQRSKTHAMGILACCAALLALASQPALAKKKAASSANLKSLTVELPANDDVFPDRPGAEALDRNCLACHSVETVMNQAALPKVVWEAEIEKMRTVYKAPIEADDIDAIVTYLTGINGIARGKWR
jgi:hypothetical protein